MTRSTHPARRRIAGATLALLFTGVACTIGASAASAADPTATLIDTVSTPAAVVDTYNVFAATGTNFFQDGVVDPQRDRLYLATPTADGEGLVTVDLGTGASSWMPVAGDSGVLDVAVSPIDGTIYLNHSSGVAPSVSVLDPAVTYTTGSPAPQVPIPGTRPSRLEVASDGRVFVASFAPRSISVLGASNTPDRMSVIQSISTLGAANGGGYTAMDAANDLLYVVADSDSTVTVVDAGADPAVVLGTFALPFYPTGAAFDAATGQLAIISIDNYVSWFDPTGDFSASTRSENLAPLPAGAEPWSASPALTFLPDGTALVVTEVWPDTINSYVSVIPPAVDGPTSIYSIDVGLDGFAIIPDTRAGGTAYVSNPSSGTVSVISGLTLTSYATTHAAGTNGSPLARLQRADGRPITATVAFTDADGADATASTDRTGFATGSIAGLTLGSRDYAVTITAPGAITLAARSSVTTIAAAAAADPGTPVSQLANTGLDATGALGAASLLLALGVLALTGLRVHRRRAAPARK